MSQGESSQRPAARLLLAKAQAALGEEDLVQASEKAWGAAAQALKALAERRGWAHQSHRDLYQVVGRVTRETGDRRLGELFNGASGLHANFYENWMARESVEIGLAQVDELVTKLEQLAA